jgi:integrase/recombinase XerC
MASVFKRNRVVPLPDHAILFERSGTRFARWTLGGRTREARTDGTGTKIICPPDKDEPYYVAYQDPGNGRRRMRVAYTDREASEQLARRLEREAARRAEGLVDPFDAHMLAPIHKVVEEFAGGLKCIRAPQMKMHVERVVKGTACEALHQLDAPNIAALLGRLQAEEDWSDTTYNEYVASVKAFTRWCVANRRLPFDPLVGLGRIKAKAVRVTHPRRALTHEELGRLLRAAESRPTREVLTVRTGPRKGGLVADVRPGVLEACRRLGRERRLCYLIAFWLRLRRSEIKALQWSDLHLDSLPPKVRLRAATTKAKRGDSLPIHPQLFDALTEARTGLADLTKRVVRTVPDMKAFRADLAAAGIDDVDADGMFADLHGLGKSFITAMHVYGVSQRSAQSLARHQDPRLTAKTYTDEKLLPLAEELSKVPAIPDPDQATPPPLALRATGTDGACGYGSRAALMQRGDGAEGQHPAQRGTLGGEGGGSGGRAPDADQVVEWQSDTIKRHDPAPSGTGSYSEAGEGGRTLDIHVGNVTLYH